VAVAPDAVAPADDLVFGVEVGLDFDGHRRTKRRMRHLISARPLHAHRTPVRGSRQQHCVECDVVGAIVAIAAGAFDMFDRDVVARNFQHQRKIGTQQIDALTMGPDLHPVAIPLRHGARRRDRAVRDIGTGILLFNGASFGRGRSGFLAGDDGSFRGLALRPRGKALFVGQRFTGRPYRALA